MTAIRPSSLDALRQRYLAIATARMPAHLAALRFNTAQVAGIQRDGLRRLLAHAIEYSPYHGARLRGVDPATFQLDQLTSLPTMTKADMMTNFDEAVTDRRVTLAAVESHLAATHDTPEAFAGDFICTTTGGSSGLRGVFVYNLEAVADEVLGCIRSGIALVFSSGTALPPEGPRTAMVAAPTAIHGTGAFAGLGRNVIHAPVTLPIAEIVARLNQGQPHIVSGYPSVIARLAAEQEAGRLAISPIVIATTSEQLTAVALTRIESAFGAPVVNSFGSSEGVLGAGAPSQLPITFASDLAILELVDENNRPVPEGVASAKVLVTNLFNLTQPLIRYELNDSMVRLPDSPNHGHFIASVEGRSDETFVYGDLRIHPLTIRSELLKAGVIEYQVRQTPQGADIDVVAGSSLDEARLQKTLEKSLSAAGLTGPIVSLQTTDRIERNPQTGKIRRFVPLA